ncbi:adenylate/guanylate cyclase domain-containing protein [Bacillus spizizenii]|nr:adenylate cyclase [Bacillus sp. BSC154]MCY7829983.1 adenylate/guanylate cyclase domain-containing protein [Bacillus spizizenii]MCY7842920.1 adenylate/guanylate cyclase domain-containing protein [Bacillus spizizenii]MCY9315787.1 adenylate/guanylate cyclase domain-containing protein [Bacillus spizizenii]MEC0560523.1 adenylate/guanylate cyclase domain-containing protein [Bacillus spizizenii]
MRLKKYDYIERKSKVEGILDEESVINKVNKFPKDEDNFTYTNGYKAWAAAIFVDLRDSTSLFISKNDIDVAKVIRGFTSEIIEILRKEAGDNLKEIGIRGDCVYAIYSAPTCEELYYLAERAFYINTYMRMLNDLLSKRDLPRIKAGIGLDASVTLAVKAGRKSFGISNLVWIGASVAKASKLSDLGNKNSINPIVMSNDFYSGYTDVQGRLDNTITHPWIIGSSPLLGTYYHSDIVISDFDKWIDGGMKSLRQ